MKLKVTQQGTNHHTDMVTASCWTPSNELYTCSDDNTICKWGMDGELIGEVCKVDVFITGIYWFPAIGNQSADNFAICCTDGTVRLMSQSGGGRAIEKTKVQVQKVGSVISVKGNHDGQSLVTAGEDGSVKVWSRTGNLRSTLGQVNSPVYSVCWGPDNDQILFAAGKELHIQSMQVGKKKLKWKGHDGVVMQVDWNSVNNLIISCGEDCRYKLWDSFGRQLYQSQPFDYVITSISWCPNGEMFAVGSFNMLRLCDKTGWSYCRERPQSGSIMQIAWTSDGTLMAGAGGNGAVVFGQLVERKLQWQNVEVESVDPCKVRAWNCSDETMEELDFRDRVLEMSLGFGHLILATATQCHIYNVNNWNTPHIFDLRNPVNVIVQSSTHFITIDNFVGVQVYTYEGRAKGNPRSAGLRAEFLNRKTVSLSSDTIAILDKSDGKTIRLFDVETGRPLSATITHTLEIVELAISQHAKGPERKVCYLDRARNMYVTPVSKVAPYKLHTQVDSMAWNDASDMLLAIADSKVRSWYFPTAIFVDRDLLDLSTDEIDGHEFGKIPEIISFFGSRAQVRRADGAVLTASVSPYPAMLYEFVGASRWEEAVRLCRFVKRPTLWACLAAMSLHGRHLETAEIALAAIQEVDKLQYITYIQTIPSQEGRNAELALYRKAADEAEMILLQAQPPLVYRAIKMNIRLFRWHRALELAVSNKTHVDTVLGYRQKYLEKFQKKETDPKFKKYFDEIEIDWEAIAAKKAAAKESEAERAGGGGGGGGGGDHK